MNTRICAAIICCILIGFMVVHLDFNEPSAYQIVEKGEYSRIQYITRDRSMTPEFIIGYYYVLRDYQSGAENKVEISKEEYESCVVGDTVDKYRGEEWNNLR